MNQQLTPDKIFETMIAFGPAKALMNAVELGMFTELAKGPLDLQTLTERFKLNPRGAQDYCDFLVSLHFLDRQNGKYSNTPDTDLFLDRNKPSYIGGFVEFIDTQIYPSWALLEEGLRTGKVQNQAKEQGSDDIFESIYSKPDDLRNFLRGMSGSSKPLVRSLATLFPWQKYQTFVDVGTAEGECPIELALAHKHLTGYGLDLPAVQPYFEEYVSQFELQDRLHFVAGNFFEVDLPTADVVIIGQVLQDWNLEQKQFLIQKAYHALPPGGALIVYEAMMDDERRENVYSFFVSMSMLLQTVGGFNYTSKECMSWMQAAGFSQTYVETLAGPCSMVVGIK